LVSIINEINEIGTLPGSLKAYFFAAIITKSSLGAKEEIARLTRGKPHLKLVLKLWRKREGKTRVKEEARISA